MHSIVCTLCSGLILFSLDFGIASSAQMTRYLICRIAINSTVLYFGSMIQIINYPLGMKSCLREGIIYCCIAAYVKAGLACDSDRVQAPS